MRIEVAAISAVPGWIRPALPHFGRTGPPSRGLQALRGLRDRSRRFTGLAASFSAALLVSITSNNLFYNLFLGTTIPPIVPGHLLCGDAARRLWQGYPTSPTIKCGYGYGLKSKAGIAAACIGTACTTK